MGRDPAAQSIDILTGLNRPSPCRIIGPGPTFLPVPHVTPGNEKPLPPRWGDIEAFAGLEVNPGPDNVDMDTSPLFIMPHGCPAPAIGIKAGQRRFLETVEDLPDLGVRRFAFRCPGQDPTGVTLFEIKGIGNPPDPRRIATQHPDSGTFLLLVIPEGKQICRRPLARSRAMVEKTDHHGPLSLVSSK